MINDGFKGHFDGKGHTVSGIRIFDSSYSQGIFGCIAYAEVKNVTLSDSRITSEGIAGGIVGEAYFRSVIANCHVKGNVCIHSGVGDTTGGGASTHGGIVGSLDSSIISHCTSSAKLTHGAYTPFSNFGGIVGFAGSSSTISHCLAVGVTVPSTQIDLNGAICGTCKQANLDHNYYADCVVAGKTANIGCGILISKREGRMEDLNDADNPDGAVPAIVLRDGDTNACAFADIAGQTTNVALYALATAKGGEWSTLCLPFSVGDLAGTPLENFAVKELDSVSAGGHATGFGEGALQLSFRDFLKKN